jgi:hypothetical protein
MGNHTPTRTSGQGRPKGALNKATRDIKLAAREFGVPAIARLAQLSGLMLPDKPGAESESAQIAAIKELLDRGFGKATQPLSGDPDGSPLAIDFRWADALPAALAEPAIDADETITVTFDVGEC